MPEAARRGHQEKEEIFLKKKNRKNRRGYDKHKPFVPNKINEKKLEAPR